MEAVHLLPDADPVNLDHEQLAAVMLHSRLKLQVSHESGHKMGEDFCMVTQLECDNPFVAFGWIRHDIGKVTIQ